MRSLKLEPVYFNTELSNKVIDYLKNQKYIKFKKINIFLRNNFSKIHPYGFIIVDKNYTMCGFLGTMFSKRIGEDSKEYIFCNLHTWIVEEKYRLNFFANSKKLLQPIFEYNCTFFAKPVVSLIRMFERNFGMTNLEMKFRIAFLPKFEYFFKEKKFEIITNPGDIEKRLSQDEFSVYSDHKSLSCYKFLVKEKNTQAHIFIIAQKKRKKLFFNFFELIYVSDTLLLKNSFSEISLKISQKYKVLFCAQNFLEESQCSIPENEKIVKDFKQKIVFKNMPNFFKFNVLYSEFVY